VRKTADQERRCGKTRERRYALFACVLHCLLLQAGASAQQRAGETIEVSIVNVDVHVTDKKGHRVPGLTAEDFEIRENGRVQPITNFAEYASAIGVEDVSIDPAAVAAGSPPPSARRTIVIFIEPVALAGFRAKELYDSIRDLVRRSVRPGDGAAIATWTTVLRTRVPLTDDVATLTSMLDVLEKESTGVPGNPGEEVRRRQAESDAFDQEKAAFLAEKGISLPAGAGGASWDARSAAKHQLFQIRNKTSALESLMQSISGVEGRKIIVMATQRFGWYAGAEFFGGTVPVEYRAELDTSSYRSSLIRNANALGITLYPIHPEGLAWTPFGDAVSKSYPRNEVQDLQRGSLDNAVLLNETTALGEIAADTGGLMAWGSKDIAAVLPRVTDDMNAYYSLAYRTRGAREDVTRAITVRTKNPDYVVRARRQFVEKSDTSRMKDRVVASLYQDLGGASIPIDVHLGKLSQSGRNRWSAPLTIRIPIGKLTTLREANGETGAFSVFVVTGAVLGTKSEVERRTQPFTIPIADLRRARASTFKYELVLQLDRTSDRIAVGILDETSKEFGLMRATIPPRP